ncbi:hypothetical protein [Egbenema bharatensis]|uniref:hypothetical protein n=1 Tax=Egbenema bharatensis TaxID=3463334 RepID=UPI003A87EB09
MTELHQLRAIDPIGLQLVGKPTVRQLYCNLPFSYRNSLTSVISGTDCILQRVLAASSAFSYPECYLKMTYSYE